MGKLNLKAEKRTVLGRKIKKIRREGLLPANVYGKKVASLSLQLDAKEFAKIYQEAGETGMIDLSVSGEKEVRPVLIHNIQKDPVSEDFLHVDFRQVILTEKVTATIPVQITGEAPAETQKLGILVQQTSEIEIEALPADLPERFVVDVSKLAEVNQTIFLKDLTIDRKKIEIKTDPEQIIVKIEPLAKEEVVAPPPAAEVPAEGAAPTEGEAPKTEGTSAAPAETKPPEGKEKTEG